MENNYVFIQMEMSYRGKKKSNLGVEVEEEKD